MLDARSADWSRANSEFDTAIDGFRRATNAEGETEAIYQRGSLNLQAVKLDDARQLLNQALDRARLTQNAFQQIRAEIDLSTVELRSGHTDNAIALATQAMQAAADQPVEVMYSRANRGLGNAYSANREYERAEPLLREAIRLSHEDSDGRLEAGSLALLSDLHHHTGRYSEAASEAAKVLAYYDKQQNPQLVVPAARAAANAYRDLGQFQKAADLANLALTVASDAKRDGLVGEAEEAVGAVELARQRYADAAGHLRLALDAYTRAKAIANVPNENVQCGIALAASGKFQEAGRFFDAAAAMAAERRGWLDEIRIERATMELYRGNAGVAAKLVSGVTVDASDDDQSAQLALIADAARRQTPLEGARVLLNVGKKNLTYSLRQRVRFSAALDLFRGHDFAGALAALGPVNDFLEMAELSWRVPLLESRLSGGKESAAYRSDAFAALTAASPHVGYLSSNDTPSARLDLRDELRDLTIMSSGK